MENFSTTGKRLFYRGLRFTSRMTASLLFSFRTTGAHHLDFDGGAIILSSHQSMMDPVLVGLISNQRLCYLARKTLFKNQVFAWLIRTLDAIEIDRERGGLSGLKEMLRRLKKGDKVLMFPEGTRTLDGKIGPLKPGFIPIARRAEVPLVPVAIVGAYDCLPRGASMPTRKPIAVVVGDPIYPEEYLALSDDEIIARLASRMETLHQQGVDLTYAHQT